MRYCICDLSLLLCSFQPSPENSSTRKRSQMKNPFHFLCKPHAMFCISWIKDACAFMSVAWDVSLLVFFFFLLLDIPPLCWPSTVSSSFCLPSLISSLSFSLSPFLRSPCQPPAAPASIHSLGSTGSETVTQSSLVIGHGHANQTGRNLQLIRILPPAIIVLRQTPPPTTTLTKLITFRGLFPLLVFLFWNCIIKGQIPRQHSPASFSITERQTKSQRAEKAQAGTRPSRRSCWQVGPVRLLNNHVVTHTHMYTCRTQAF